MFVKNSNLSRIVIRVHIELRLPDAKPLMLLCEHACLDPKGNRSMLAMPGENSSKVNVC